MSKPVKTITEPVKVEKLIPGGQALGTLADGKKVMLWGALPGETVTEWRVMKEKTSYAEGIAIKIEHQAEERVAPADSCYLSTSPWQIMTYDYELAQKRELLQEILRQQKIDCSNTEINAVATNGQDFYYRNKMEYALYYDKAAQKIFPAFRARGSHLKLAVQKSSLERPEIWAQAEQIIADLNARGEDARRYQSLLLRCNQKGEVSGGLFENRQPRPVFKNLTDQILGQTYTYSPNGFFQINLPVYEMVLTEIKQWIRTGKVLDLYAGVGTIGLSVARDRDLTLVECDQSAYHELERNSADTKARPVLAKSEDALEYIAPDQTVIVDPPRAGCFTTVIEKFLEVLPERIIYLSCNPITQARDLVGLQAKYRIQKIAPYNFFPRTPHLENLIVLERKDG